MASQSIEISYLPIALPTFLIGILILLYVWSCWSGKNRGWLEHSRRWTWLVLGPMPGWGVLALGMGIGMLDYGGAPGRAVMYIGGAGSLLGFFIGIAEPSWWGPSWFREHRRIEEDNAIRPEITSVEIMRAGTEPLSSEEQRLMNHLFDKVQSIDEWKATLVAHADGSGEPGRLHLYSDGLLFIAERIAHGATDTPPGPSMLPLLIDDIDNIQLVYKLGELTDGSSEPIYTEREIPLLLIVNDNGPNVMLDTPFVTSTARRIADVVGCTVEESR